MRSLFAALVLSLFSLPAFAWGETGHRIICEVALGKLNPEATAMVEELMGFSEHLSKTPPANFADACLWPDDARHRDYKGSYEQHFINVPKTASGISLSRDCAALDCIVVGIQKNLVYLSRPAENRREKARKAAALFFVAHFIGDLHQPLHVGHGEDWGGNKISVSFRGKNTNLHALWDTVMPEASGIQYPKSVRQLAKEPVPEGSRSVLAWMKESYQHAQQSAYADTNGKQINSGDKISNAYFKRSKPLIQKQMLLASDRLVFVLNGIAAGTFDTNILIN